MFVLANISNSRTMIKWQNSPGCPVGCKHACSLMHPCPSPNEYHTRQGVCTCPNDTTHEVLAMGNDVCSALQEVEEGRHVGMWLFELQGGRALDVRDGKLNECDGDTQCYQMHGVWCTATAKHHATQSKWASPLLTLPVSPLTDPPVIDLTNEDSSSDDEEL